MIDFCLIILTAPLPDYDFPSGAEIGRALMEMARTSQFDYNKPPPSFEIEAFLIPDDQLVVPLFYLREIAHNISLIRSSNLCSSSGTSSL
jgi:hypothetical protein